MNLFRKKVHQKLFSYNPLIGRPQFFFVLRGALIRRARRNWDPEQARTPFRRPDSSGWKKDGLRFPSLHEAVIGRKVTALFTYGRKYAAAYCYTIQWMARLGHRRRA